MPATNVVMETSLGTIKIELDGDKAPITVGQFSATWTTSTTTTPSSTGSSPTS